ncbi:MAG: hypothetical protein WCI97_08940 [Bacteroidota bacterium]
MQTSKQKNHLKNFVAFSLVMYAVIGFSSQAFSSEGVKHFMWAVSAFFMIIGSTLLSSKLTRADNDFPAAGFIILSIGQAMSYGFIATHDAGNEQFGAVIAIYIPGLILISFYNLVPWFLRISGFLSALCFTILAILIYKGSAQTAIADGFTSGAFMAMNIAIVGWAWLVYKNRI